MAEITTPTRNEKLNRSPNLIDRRRLPELVVGEGGRRTLDSHGKKIERRHGIALSATRSYSPERDSRRGALEPIEPRRINLVHYQADAAGDNADDDDEEGQHVRNEVVGDDDRPSPLAEEGHDLLPRLEVSVAVLWFSRRCWRGGSCQVAGGGNNGRSAPVHR